jgi:hypothetical protein
LPCLAAGATRATSSTRETKQKKMTEIGINREVLLKSILGTLTLKTLCGL